MPYRFDDNTYSERFAVVERSRWLNLERLIFLTNFTNGQASFYAHHLGVP